MLIKLNEASKIYLNELFLKIKQKEKFLIVYLLSSSIMIILIISFLCPVLGKVNITRMRVLTLFVDIPIHHVDDLAGKCENFISSFSDE